MNVKSMSEQAELRVVSTHVYQQVTVSNTAVAITPVSGCRYVWWTVEAYEVRVREDGTAPDANTGHKIAAGSSGIWARDRFASAKWIRGTSNDAKISITELG